MWILWQPKLNQAGIDAFTNAEDMDPDLILTVQRFSNVDKNSTYKSVLV